MELGQACGDGDAVNIPARGCDADGRGEAGEKHDLIGDEERWA